MKKYHGDIVIQFDTLATGNAGSNKLVTVYLTGTTNKADLFEDDETTPLDNPVAAGGIGNYSFKVANGTYDLVIDKDLGSEFSLTKVQIFDAETVVNSGTFNKHSVVVIGGQPVLDLPFTFETAIPVIDGVVQSESHGAYTFDGVAKTVTLSENLVGTELIEVWTNDLFLQSTIPVNELPLGDIANPFIFQTTYNFVNSLPYIGIFKVGDWVQVTGRTLENDGYGAKYEIVDTSPVNDKGVAIRFNFENYIPVDAEPTVATLWAVLRTGFQRNFAEQAIEIIAHRSFNFMGVQNTPLNDGAAMKYDVQSLETDIQVPLDATTGADLVRFHDLTVDADTDGTGAISSLTLAQVRALTLDRVASTIYADRVKIAKFDEFVGFAKSVGARIYPEIKQYRSLTDIQLMIDVIEDHEYESMTIMQSFLIDDLVEVRRINKRVGVGWLTVQINTEQQFIDFDKLQKLKWSDVLMREDTLRSFPSNVAQIYDAGIGIAAWGLEDNTEMNKLLEVGVYRLMIDQPILTASVRGLTNVNY